MIVIILAAGRGARLELGQKSKFGFSIPFLLLNSETLGQGRPLLRDEFLVENVFRALEGEGSLSYLFVLGYRFVENTPLLAFLAQKYGARINYVVNPWFAETNTAYSLHLALESLWHNGYQDDLLILNGDNYLCRRTWQRLRQERRQGGSFLVIDPVRPLTPESFKIKLQGGVILDMGKHLRPEESQGEFIGVSFWQRQHVPLLVEAVREMVASNRQEYYDRAFIPLSHRGLLRYVFLREGECWTEIDFPEDLRGLREILAQEDAAP